MRSSAMFQLTEVYSGVWEDAMSIDDLLLSEFVMLYIC